MTSKHLEELLQQCIAAFDAGIEPEECLNAFPAQRAELEPLFRQAISLRVAFAASPRPEFRQRTRERVLFMAGRDVSAAFAARPDPEFIKDARQRFIRAAGAEAQEALRAVPPPRMPFWANTRRRLLERAAESQRATQPVARPMGGIYALRAGMSMAVVALVMALGAFIYSISVSDSPSTNPAFAQLEQDIAELQRAHDAGTLTPENVQQVTAQVNMIVQQPQQPAAVVEKLPELISKQQQVVAAAASEGILAPEVAQAQTQQLQAAQEKAELRLAAARAEDPTATPALPTPVTTNTAVAGTVLTPITSTTPAPVVTPPAPDEPVVAGQIRVTASADNTANKSWKTIELANMSFNVPDSWTFIGGIELDGGKYGFGVLDVSRLNINADSAATLIVNVDSGRIDVLMADGTQLTLRIGGIDGAFISQDDLVAKAGALVGDLRHIRDTFEPAGALIPPPPTPTPSPSPTPTNTATPVPTATPPATSSPSPSATP